MQYITQTAFANIMNVNRSTVSRWKQEGRLVMDESGKRVDVEASKIKVKETEGGRDDVAARHAADKNQQDAPEAEAVTKAKEARASAQARKETAQANMAEMEEQAMRDELADVIKVKGLVEDSFITFRQSLENGPHRWAPQLVGKDTDVIRSMLKEFMREELGGLERFFIKKLNALAEQSK